MRITLPERVAGGQPFIAAFARNVLAVERYPVVKVVGVPVNSPRQVRLAAETGRLVLCGGVARVLGPEPAGGPTTTGMEVLREFIPAVTG